MCRMRLGGVGGNVVFKVARKSLLIWVWLLARYVVKPIWGWYVRMCGLRWVNTWVSRWGPVRECILLYQSSCGRMRMVRASGYRAQCSALTMA